MGNGFKKSFKKDVLKFILIHSRYRCNQKRRMRKTV